MKSRSGKIRQRGAALLIVMTIVVILSVLALDFSYNAKINLNLAANSRDSVKAFFMAKSAINIARLVLYYQKQVDQTMSSMNLPGLGNSIQLWKLIPIESDFTKSLLGGDLLSAMGIPVQAAEAEKAAGAGGSGKEGSGGGIKSGFGGFDGTFSAQITDEEGKISVRNFDQLSGLRNLSMAELLTLLLPAKYNYMFENRDIDDQFTNRLELIGAIKDYMDTDEKMYDFTTGQDIGPPEDPIYQRLQKPYVCKNATYDTLQELRMVRGVGDAFFSAFSERLTVYPVTKLNLSSADDLMISAFVCGFAKDKNNPFCTDTTGSTQKTIMENYHRYKTEKAGLDMFYSPSLQDIKEFFSSQGVPLNDSMAGLGKLEDAITNSSSFFTIKATGRAGKVTKNITTVVYTGGGKSDILYWRED